MGGLGSIPGLGRSPGEGNGNPLQYSCLENPMDSGAWWATVHRVAESDTTERLHSLTHWPSGFPYFVQFKLKFCSKELMIWATVSSRSCFCWLYQASPSLAAKNTIDLISVFTIWWCPCVESSLVLLEKKCLLWAVHSLAKTLLVFALLHFVLQGQTCLLLQVSLNLLFCILVPYDEEDIFFFFFWC